MQKLTDTLFQGAAYLAGVFMVATLLAVLASIFGRIIPVLDLPGSDAYAGYCMAAAGFLALAPTLCRGEHIRVTLVFNQLPPRAQHGLDVFCHLVALGLASALAWFSLRLVLQSHEFSDISTGLDATPLWIPQTGMAIGTALFALAFLRDLILLLARGSLSRATGDNEPARVE